MDCLLQDTIVIQQVNFIAAEVPSKVNL